MTLFMTMFYYLWVVVYKNRKKLNVIHYETISMLFIYVTANTTTHTIFTNGNGKQ